jgi:hypothetical protein
VNGDGHSISIKGVAEGTAVITATTQDGGKAAQCEVTVRDTPVEVADLILNTESLFLVVAEAPFILRARIDPWYANIGNNLTWSAAPAGIVTITDTTTEDTNLVKQITAVGAGNALITIAGGNGVSVTCPVRVVQEDFGPDIKNVTVRAGSASKLYSVFRPASIVPQVAAVTWESLNPAIATVSAAGSSGLDSFSATVTGVSAGTTRIKLSARGLESYAEVTVLPAWNIAGDWFFEDFEDYRFKYRNPELGGDYPLNETGYRAEPGTDHNMVTMNHWVTAHGPTTADPIWQTLFQYVTMENSRPNTTILGGENKVARYYCFGTGERRAVHNFNRIIAGDTVYAEFDWYPGSPSLRWGVIGLMDRYSEPDAVTTTNKIISFSVNDVHELRYIVGNFDEPREDPKTGIRIFESIESMHQWFHVTVTVDFAAGTVSFVVTQKESSASESATVPLPADITYNRQIASMRMFGGRNDTGGWSTYLDNMYVGTAPMPQN